MPVRRVLISIDERLLDRIDRAVERRGLTRSGYLAHLADADLGGSREPGADAAVAAVLQAIEELFAESHT